MYKYWKFYLLKKLVIDPVLAAQIYNMLYHKGQPPKTDNTFYSASIATPSVQQKPEPNSKKKEMIDALQFLKSKPNKTKQDRESIGMLEAAIKNQID